MSLSEPVPAAAHGNVRVIILYPEPIEGVEQDQDDAPIEEIKTSLRRALQEATSGQRIPLSQMWEGIVTE